MEKEEIIKKFLERGRLLTPKAVEFLLEKDINDFLDDNYTTLVLDESSILIKDKIKIIKNLIEKKKEITTEDFISFYKSKYEKMKNIITNRIQKDFISLNKLNLKRNEVYVIGIVKDIKQKEEKKIIELEDMTTTVSAIFDAQEVEGLDLDDVVAVKAISAGNIIYGKKILYPDIPLRPPIKGHGKICFISDLHLDEAPLENLTTFLSWFEKENIKYLFVAGDIGNDEIFEKLINTYCYNKKVFVIPGNIDSEEYPQIPKHYTSKYIISLSNPSIVEINGVKILIIHKMNIDMLKKRYLGRANIILSEDYLPLEDVPDIVHFGHTHEPQILNYKSVTLVNSGSLLTQFKPVLIDLSTRETVYIDIDKIKK
ncbi:MAG: metallophosphoesterase family protein [Candidatus Aenigmatarchaeota archaeon]